MLLGIDDQQLVHVVGGVERQLVPAVVTGRHDLHHQRRRRHIHPVAQLTVQTAVGHTVLAELAKIERADHRHQPGRTRWPVEQHGKLLGHVGVALRRRRVHPVHTSPLLVEQIQPQLPTPLE